MVLTAVKKWLKRDTEWETEPVSVFLALYGRRPTPGECAVLDRIPWPWLTTSSSKYRAVIAAFDRQQIATPFSVRFCRGEVAPVSVNGYELVTDLADVAVGGPLRAENRYEPHLTRFFETYIRPGMTVVDVGANIGYYTLLAAKLAGDAGKVLAFEPNSENCRLVLLSLKRNGFKNVQLFPVGLSSQLGLAYFSPHLGSNGGLLSPADEVLLNPNCVVIPTMRLDDLAADQRIHFLKMDTEGAEGLVIEGAKEVIARDRPVVTSEFSLEMLPRVSRMSGKHYLEFFRSLGYRLSIIDQGSGDLKPIDSVDAFLSTYGPATRIEDLAFLPP